MDAVTLRPIVPSDEPFLLEVYAGTRADELALTDWSDQQKSDFVLMQFRAQKHFYEANYPGAEFQVILLNGFPAGRLYTHRTERELRIMDIALLPSFRRRGLGSGIIRDLQKAAALENRKLGIHVEIFNPALRFYESLGFERVDDRGVYYYLIWDPAKASPA